MEQKLPGASNQLEQWKVQERAAKVEQEVEYQELRVQIVARWPCMKPCPCSCLFLCLCDLCFGCVVEIGASVAADRTTECSTDSRQPHRLRSTVAVCDVNWHLDSGECRWYPCPPSKCRNPDTAGGSACKVSSTNHSATTPSLLLP